MVESFVIHSVKSVSGRNSWCTRMLVRLWREDYRSQRVLGEEYGIAQSMWHAVSMRIKAVLYYLDSSFEAGDRSKQFARAMQKRAERLRPLRESAAERQRFADELGIPHLPAKLPLAYLELYRALIGAVRDGRINRLANQQENAHCALALRYGLDKLDAPEFLTLEETGQLMGGITRERVRQLEERGLGLLGIATDDD